MKCSSNRVQKSDIRSNGTVPDEGGGADNKRVVVGHVWLGRTKTMFSE